MLRFQRINDYQWEQIIRNHLPKLKRFRLKMKVILREDENIQDEADNLLDSFRSSFWIDEHQWFVRCCTGINIILLYTLSSVPDTYEDISDSWKWTCPHNNYLKYYNDMARINNTRFFDKPIPADIRLSNIQHLHMQLPINNQFWSIVPNLNQLKTLWITSHADISQYQLQTLLDRAPHLHKLCSIHDATSSLSTSLFKYTNPTIRELDLHRYKYCFNEEECLIFSRSSLGVQCEILSIRVNNRESIINIVKNMINLRILRICRNRDKHGYFKRVKNDDGKFHEKEQLNHDEIVQWLKDHLPSTCLVINDPYYVHNTLIWI